MAGLGVKCTMRDMIAKVSDLSLRLNAKCVQRLDQYVLRFMNAGIIHTAAMYKECKW